MTTNEINQKMAILFDSDQSKSFDESDYKVDNIPLEQKLEDLHKIVDKEVVEKEIVLPEKTVAETPEEEKLEAVESAKKIEKNNLENDSDDEYDILEEAEKDNFIQPSPSNPLNLSGQDLENYKIIKEKYSNYFYINENLSSMVGFYRFKVKELGYLIGRSTVVDFDKILKELKSMSFDSTIKGMPHGDIIAEKINKLTMQRERFTEIMFDVYKQLPIWKTAVDLLKGKLSCVQDVRGQHKRDGIIADHMSDMVHYLSELEAVVDTGKLIENMISHAKDSLSRQLACLQEFSSKEPIVYKDQYNPSQYKKVVKIDSSENESYSYEDDDVSHEKISDEFDELEDIG